jgi:acyl-CoA synthetase (AMP-forming)/AMP-acid ligase II
VEARIDERGELHIRGDNVHIGYVGMERNEWHATGDFARIEDDGSIVLLGRAKDMLIRGKFNLYPGLYEDTIASIPGVAACAIVGVPDPDTADEAVVLYVEPTADLSAADRAKLAETVEHGLRNGDTRIDVDALPDVVLVVAELPRAGRASKIDRAALRARAIVDTGVGA